MRRVPRRAPERDDRLKTIRIIGFCVVGLLLAGVFFTAVLAAMAGEPYLWRNYWNASITPWTIILTFGPMAVIGVIWLWQRFLRRFTGTAGEFEATAIRIVAPPIGEAPLWVREAWVGLELPLADYRRVTIPTIGVLTGPTDVAGQILANLTGRSKLVEGFIVRSAEAIGILARTAPDAAAWWRENTPAYLKPDVTFVFDSPCCEPLLPSETADNDH